ncbi:nitrate reductase molybdenum cofactor assembly chaperone [Timonella senegalensis]|uniref:nitrate reductase molybdenum cofactor assembly chaperone n=1 Tax=Timonella senegalensis TaxID=1465825 RepID=UPI0028ABD218|nr:nitrate reductase molybdenum cofactor assembly chaperone [Timonella senegalensis]
MNAQALKAQGRKGPVSIPLFRRSKRKDLVEVPDRSDILALCALLLGYPDDEFDFLRDDISKAIDGLSPSKPAKLLAQFWDQFSGQSRSDARRHYVATFDMRRQCSLFLTYYLHGDTRQRGMSLLMFKQRYRAYGFNPPENELPDYLPMVLEFAANTGPGVGEGLLRMHRNGLEAIHDALKARDTMYLLVFDAISEVLGPVTAKQRAEIDELVLAGPPQETIGLESSLTPYGMSGPDAPFGPPEFTCNTKGQ